MIRSRFVLLAWILQAAGALPLGAQAPPTASEALLAALEALEDRLPAGAIGVLSPDPEIHSLLPALENRWPRLRVIEDHGAVRHCRAPRNADCTFTGVTSVVEIMASADSAEGVGNHTVHAMTYTLTPMARLWGRLFAITLSRANGGWRVARIAGILMT